jgi:uncharacterized paraquat-inducible protein A
MTKKESLSGEPIYCDMCDYYNYPDEDGNCVKCHKPVK